MDETARLVRASGREPMEALLVKLTDGRIRILPPDHPSDRLRRLENELGPIASAYLMCGGVATELQPPARASRNSAIFAASLGIVTGAFPNVGAMDAPSGLLSPPV